MTISSRTRPFFGTENWSKAFQVLTSCTNLQQLYLDIYVRRPAGALVAARRFYRRANAWLHTLTDTDGEKTAGRDILVWSTRTFNGSEAWTAEEWDEFYGHLVEFCMHLPQRRAEGSNKAYESDPQNSVN